MVFTRFGLMQAFCQRHMTSAAESLQSGTQLSSNLFYALIKHKKLLTHWAVWESFLPRQSSEEAAVWYGGGVMN